ncbi:hypothetical protein P4B35_15465 [Pontiellaceae bacterium B12227]|nr:hypothetical protein [Pontiellaceae bacterium B12227]
MRMHDLAGFDFTVHRDPEVNRVIARQLREVAEELVALLGDRLIAVLVAGGFGRGEGGIVRDEKGIRPINDYDLYLVVKPLKETRRKFGGKIEQIAQQCSTRFGIKQIDMGLVSRWQLWIPRNSVVRYEAREGHQVIYGPEKLCIHSCKAKDIPQKEGTQYFFTRGGGLLIARFILENRDRLEGMPWFENFSIEMNKAGIALGDTELISRGEYHWSYQERLERYEKLSGEAGPDGKTIWPVYQDAVQQKLDPCFQYDSDIDLRERWSALTALFVERFLVFEGNSYGQRFYDLRQYEAFIGRTSFNLGGKLYTKLFQLYSGGRRGNPDQQRLLVFLLLAGLNDDESLCRAEKMLGLDPTGGGPVLERWLHAVEQLLKKWHPEGIVTKLVIK